MLAGRSGRVEHELRVRVGRACGPRRPPVRVNGGEDGGDRIWVVDGGDRPHATTAEGALEGVGGPDSHEEVGPVHAPGALGCDRDWAIGAGRGDDERAKVVVRSEDPMEAPQRQVGCRHESREARNEVEGLEER